jgi:excisionase family DNA binding protein
VEELENVQLLRAEDVARILKVTPSAVFKWAKAGVIPSYRIHEKCLRFKREDVAALIEKGKGVELTYKKDGHP